MTSTQSYPPKAPENGGNFTNTIHGDTYDAINPGKHADLRGRSVFISGASRGVGRATALACAAAGCRHIALAALDGIEDGVKGEVEAAAAASSNSVQAAEPPTVLTFALDVRDANAVTAAAEETARVFGGRLDILVNNAGYLEKGNVIDASDPDEYWRTFEINVRGTYLVTRAFLPLLLWNDGNSKNDGLKTLVNVGSMGALALRRGGSAYQTSKWALLKFTEFIMAEYADKGILSYIVHPGGILTQLALNMPEDTHKGLADKPELAGDTIVFLAHKRREWMAGRYISCKWDMLEFLEKEHEITNGDKLKVRLVV
ncbi:putative oxidoreductase [Xylariaceae sp. FL1651]|nr:putative oxidoreductase [Xylariaceae sp. FL1651]